MCFTTFITKDTLNIVLAILTSCSNLEFNITDSCWNFSIKNLELFLKSLEKEELVKKLNISLIYKQIDIYLKNNIIDLFETYYFKGIIASYLFRIKIMLFMNMLIRKDY
ncbi:hypothetical protein C2G38_2221064 [Gigaspora rosea]|uniref:Uncharacterized protein n=1 Tax=Gigaspora rosea TaxID=44941 RepID=A0A397UC59_9GLOM|nr:hypothetical protein C2G38_2221064 [Gigaspora rosea]